MPELPDVSVYVEAIERHMGGRVLEAVRIGGPSLLRSVEPSISAAAGRRVIGARRLGKRVVIELEPDLFLVFHLMIAGRLHWKAAGAKLARNNGLAALDADLESFRERLLTGNHTLKRARARLLKKDWPRSPEELEARRAA